MRYCISEPSAKQIETESDWWVVVISTILVLAIVSILSFSFYRWRNWDWRIEVIQTLGSKLGTHRSPFHADGGPHNPLNCKLWVSVDSWLHLSSLTLKSRGETTEASGKAWSRSWVTSPGSRFFLSTLSAPFAWLWLRSQSAFPVPRQLSAVWRASSSFVCILERKKENLYLSIPKDLKVNIIRPAKFTLPLLNH